MNAHDQRLLMRWVTGQLPAEEAAALGRRIERDADLAALATRTLALWQGLELPPASPLPLGFARRVTARVIEDREAGFSWSLAPMWVRLASAAALVLGLGLGAAAGWPDPAAAELAVEIQAASLADSYWEALESTDDPAEVAR